jgi:uncharacterized membrane protein YeiH
MTVDLLFSVAELVGTAAFAVSGAMVAVKKQLDIFGVLLLSVITALGGGAIRDLLLGHTPPRMFYSAHLVLLALLCALAVFLFVRVTHSLNLWVGSRMDMLLTLSDALGLGIFAVIGTQAGISAGYGNNAFFCIVLGMITGVGGGVLRDVFSMNLPKIFVKHFYACASIAGAIVAFLIQNYLSDPLLASIAGATTVITLRFLASFLRWNLPKPKYPIEEEKQ